jgi:hypothetical protein
MKTSAANAEASTKLFKKLGQELAEANTKITQVTEQRDGAQKKIVAKQAEIDRVHAKLDEKKGELRSQDEQLAKLGPQCYNLKQELETSRGEVASCRRALGEKDKTIKKKDESLCDKDEKIKKKEIALSQVLGLGLQSSFDDEFMFANESFGQQQQNDNEFMFGNDVPGQEQQQQADDEDMTGYDEAAAGPRDSDQMQGDIDHPMSEDTSPERTSGNQPLVAPPPLNLGEHTPEDMEAEGIDPGKDTTEAFDYKAFLEDPAIQNFDYDNNGDSAVDQGHGDNNGSNGFAGDQEMSIANDSNNAVANQDMSSASNAAADCNPTIPNLSTCIDPRLLSLNNVSSVTIPA